MGAGPIVDAAVLAAGLGERMGGPKHLVPLGGEPMLARVVRALDEARAGRIGVVLRAGDAAGEALARSLGADVAFTRPGEEGRAATVHAAVRAARRQAAGLLFALADQPFLRAADFDALIDAFAREPVGIVHARYRGERGSPTIFARRYFPQLLALRGDEGGRKVIAARRADSFAVDLEPARGRDVDRPEDV